MKAVLYILRFHGFGLTVSLTVLGFGVWGLLAYMPPVSSERDVILKAPYEVLPVHFILIAFVVAGKTWSACCGWCRSQRITGRCSMTTVKKPLMAAHRHEDPPLAIISRADCQNPWSFEEWHG
jgi:hypothetical protein